jgi:hypothetical protein
MNSAPLSRFLRGFEMSNYFSFFGKERGDRAFGRIYKAEGILAATDNGCIISSTEILVVKSTGTPITGLRMP